MSDAQAAVSSDDQAAQPQFNLQRIYLRDASLEIPLGPQVFLNQSEPRLEFELDTTQTALGDDLHEVTVRCTVTCRLGDQVGFLVESVQGGIFEIRNVSEEQLTLLTGISCPNILYPYLRANVADLIQRASLPPLHLAEINWEAFFHQKQARQAATQQ